MTFLAPISAHRIELTHHFWPWTTLWVWVMFDPPAMRKGQKLKLLCSFFRRQFASFCLFLHLNRPRLASQWVWPNFFGRKGGLTIPPHHSIAKYLKNLKSMSRTGTFILRHCVNISENDCSISYSINAACTA